MSSSLQAIARAPSFVRKMAVGNVEDFAEEQQEAQVTLAVVKAQADSVGMGRFMRGDGTGGPVRRLLNWLGGKR